MFSCKVLVTMFSKLLVLVIIHMARAQVNLPEDGTLNFTGLAAKYGQRAEEHDVVTEDGYILKLFRIIGDRDRPVLLVHGAIDSSDDFILRGNRSMAIMLANSGYDVWAINHRGNRYSRRHLTLNPDLGTSFWDFSMTEFGEMDLPATIDFIHRHTTAKLGLIGYSEGATSSLILGAKRTEYNERISVLVAIAPVCYLRNTDRVTTFALAPFINNALRSTNAEEFFGFYSPIRNILAAFCSMIGYEVCVKLDIFPKIFFNNMQLEASFLQVLIGHFPAGTSRKNLNHFAQIARSRTFSDYDYGTKENVARYGSREPPVFPLNKATMKVAVISAQDDLLSRLEDVGVLRQQLPNVVANIVLQRLNFNHLDLILGRSSFKVVVPHVLDVLQRFSN